MKRLRGHEWWVQIVRTRHSCPFGEDTAENGFVPDEPETQQQRAMRAIEAIFSGGDLQAETLQLSNEFTDRQVERLSRALRRTPRD